MLRKRSLSLAGHTTSLALEPAFWDVLEAMAAERRRSLTGVIAEIDAG
ncbi:MAG TPA: ribbon-helix-helix domain-containing protein, partial [Caulobacteraceae bacterium]